MAGNTLLIDDGIQVMNWSLRDFKESDVIGDAVESSVLNWLTYGITGEVLLPAPKSAKKQDATTMTSYKAVRERLSELLQEAHGLDSKSSGES